MNPLTLYDLYRILVHNAFMAALLLVPAGTLCWPAAWVQIAVYLATYVAERLLMDPELKDERDTLGTHEGTEAWDYFQRKLRLSIQYSGLVVCGLDYRFGWSMNILPISVRVLAGIVAMGAYVFRSWAEITNRYFSTVVRIQKDRGHKVCSDGPYRFVRHPGYISRTSNYLFLPIMLGTIVGLIPGCVNAGLYVVRAIMEEETLIHGLEGYKEYTQKVRYRFVPGIW